MSWPLISIFAGKSLFFPLPSLYLSPFLLKSDWKGFNHSCSTCFPSCLHLCPFSFHFSSPTARSPASVCTDLAQGWSGCRRGGCRLRRRSASPAPPLGPRCPPPAPPPAALGTQQHRVTSWTSVPPPRGPGQKTFHFYHHQVCKKSNICWLCRIFHIYLDSSKNSWWENH